ncbi:MAG: hypothetical protein CM15mP18_4400 [Methanobacteriota archaeon]|nr:MAG: hypothetical protein CM15mP18_4400 [Euryarchaeota archaeon]
MGHQFKKSAAAGVWEHSRWPRASAAVGTHGEAGFSRTRLTFIGGSEPMGGFHEGSGGSTNGDVGEFPTTEGRPSCG